MSQLSITDLQQKAVALLKELIALPSFSREEQNTATALEGFLSFFEIPAERYQNNVWAKNKYFDAAKPTILLNSHHDTVKPNKGYTLDPFTPLEEGGKLFGLGSNDAGGALVSLLAAFIYYYKQPHLTHNLVFAATAEEEISGVNGIEGLLQSEAFLRSCSVQVGAGFHNWAALVGEPTLLQLAIAERGLMVLDCVAEGKAGHAARQEGINALYKAMEDIAWFRMHQFEKVSPFLGPVQMTVTVIETENKAHNVVPAQCKFVVDVRLNELYTFEELLHTIRANVHSQVQPRSCRLRSTKIEEDHALVKAGLALGRTCYGSPTSSDKALMLFPALKIGPGDSARSHTADEFIFVSEVQEGIELYIKLLHQVLH